MRNAQRSSTPLSRPSWAFSCGSKREQLTLAPLAALGVALLGSACQKRPEATVDGVHDAASPSSSVSPSPSASPSSPRGAALFRVRYGYVVMGRSTPALQRTGAPRLVYRRDDHDESFLAESAIDELSLSADIRSLHGVKFEFYGGAGPSPCEAQVSAFKAIAWAMPQGPTLAPTWDEMAEGPLANAVFERGNIYVVGVVSPTGPRCPGASWAATGNLEVRFEEAQSLDRASQPDAITLEPSVPYLGDWDNAYSLLQPTSKGGKLPGRWRGLPITTRVWGFVRSPLASLKIVNFERNVTPELVGRPNESGKPWFSRGGVAIWKVGDAGLEFVGPHRSVLDDSEELLAVTAVLVSRQLTLLSLTSSRHYTALRRVGGQFEIADELSIAPAP
jgi:hypothetical protein